MAVVKKERCDWAVDQLNSKNFDNVAAPNQLLLRGKVAGVQVTHTSSGEPGAGASIRMVVTLLFAQEMDHLLLLMELPRRWRRFHWK
jgi:hypothetical protein